MSGENKKTNSIVNRLNRYLRWKSLCSSLGGLLGLGLAALIGWCAAAEQVMLGSLALRTPRGISFPDHSSFFALLRSARYEVEAANGMPYAAEMGPFLLGLFWVLAALTGASVLGWLLCWGEEQRRLRNFLKPIDEIALSAERISARAFDTGKLASFEDAISHISAPETRVHVDDDELTGLEAAVNNMLKRVEASSRQQMRFVDDASHELRTPIAVIQGYVNLLDRWGKDDPKVLAESISAIQAEAEHMKTLVEQLLFLARGDMGRTALTLAPLALAPLVREIHDESRMIDSEHAYLLEIAAEPAANADVAMLKQAVRILVDNAAKYTEAGGEILLRLRTEGDEALIDAQDSGIGISSEDAPHVFDRFYRANEAREKGGSGLGLSIAQWIVERHGGRIQITSYTGVGTRMTIRLPRIGDPE